MGTGKKKKEIKEKEWLWLCHIVERKKEKILTHSGSW